MLSCKSGEALADLSIYAILGYVSALAVGLSLGLIGGGGSILSVPILVYLFDFSPEDATAYSMLIVGLSAMKGLKFYWTKRLVKFSRALAFAIPSATGVVFTRKILLPNVPDVIYQSGDFSVSRRMMVLGVFALVMMLSARKLIRGSSVANKQSDVKPQTFLDTVKLLVLGGCTGLLTGFVGAGGGFLIVPLLMTFAHFGIKEAIGTSLLIIAINSTFGFAASYDHLHRYEPMFAAIYISLAMIGVSLGTRLSERISAKKLEPIFGWFIVVMAFYIIGREFF